MSYLDRKDLISADLRTRVVSTKSAIKYYNTDKNIAYIYMKLVTKNEDGAEKEIQKDEASNYNVTITVKKRGNDVKEVVGVLSDDIVDETCAIYKFILPSEFTDQVGECVCETVVKNNDKELVMNTFVYSVKSDMLTGLNGEIITDPDFPVLKQLIEEVKETAQTVNNIDNVNVSDTKTYSNKKIEEKFSGVSSQIKEKANKDDIFSMSNMGQDIKEAMTGGSVAVVGRNSVLKENIVPKQVTPEKTNFIDVVTDNLIYGVNYDVGKAVKPTDGTLYDVSSYQTTDFVNCLEGQQLVFTGTTNLCFYDENKSFVEGKQGGQWTSPITVPTNAKYFRWSFPIKDEATSYVCLKGNTNINPKFYLNNDLFETTKEKLMLDLNINYPLKNKKINVLGDSNSSLDYLTPNWLQNIENRTGVIANNYGVSGTTIAYNENRENNAGKCFANRVGELNDCDVTIIMGGTNDVNSQIPLGNWDDTTNETLYGAINIIITTLLNKFPGKPIVWCTPIQDRNSYKNKPVANLETTVLGASAMANVNYTLLNGAIKLKCRQYGIHFINLYEESGINGFDTNFIYYRNSTDTVHMSLLAHERVSNIIQSKLEEII